MDAIRDSQLIDSSLVDQDGMIHRDALCPACGYNLRGLHSTSRCPECDAEALRALYPRSEAGTFLKFCEPQWLNKLRLGIALMLAAWLLWNLGILLFTLATPLGMDPRALSLFMMVIGAALDLPGRLILTSKEPEGIPCQSSGKLRTLIRVTAVLKFFGSSMQRSFVLGVGSTSLIYGLSFDAIYLAAGIATMMYLRLLAIRLPDSKLASSMSVVIWGWGSCVCLGMLTQVYQSVAPSAVSSGNGSGGPWFFDMLQFVQMGGFQIFNIWYIVVLFRFLSRLGVAKRHASTLAEPGPAA